MSLLYDGHDLETIGICGDPSFTFANYRATTEDMESANGEHFIGSKIAAGSVSFHVAIFGSANERRRKISTLASWLNVDEPKQLVLPDTPGWYYLAVPDGGIEISEHMNPERFVLTFKLTDPIAYGVEEKSVAISYGGSKTFYVGGTAPTKPYFNRTIVSPDKTTKQWGWRLDGQDVFILDFGTTSNRYIQADFEKRVSYVGNALKLPTLDSDWFELTPGVHTIENHIGGGTSVMLRWHERWL